MPLIFLWSALSSMLRCRCEAELPPPFRPPPPPASQKPAPPLSHPNGQRPGQPQSQRLGQPQSQRPHATVPQNDVRVRAPQAVHVSPPPPPLGAGAGAGPSAAEREMDERMAACGTEAHAAAAVLQRSFQFHYRRPRAPRFL